MIDGIRRRNHQAIRLNGVVDAADVASHDKTLLSDPFGLTSQQLIGPLDAFCQQRIGFIELVDFEEFLIVQCTPDGSFKDHHIGQQRFRIGIGGSIDRGKFFLQLAQSCSHRGRSIVRHGNTEHWNATDVFCNVVLNAVCV